MMFLVNVFTCYNGPGENDDNDEGFLVSLENVHLIKYFIEKKLHLEENLSWR